MAGTDTFLCSGVPPERVSTECDARFVARPALGGEDGLLRNRAPLLGKVDGGRLRIWL